MQSSVASWSSLCTSIGSNCNMMNECNVNRLMICVKVLSFKHKKCTAFLQKTTSRTVKQTKYEFYFHLMLGQDYTLHHHYSHYQRYHNKICQENPYLLKIHCQLPISFAVVNLCGGNCCYINEQSTLVTLRANFVITNLLFFLFCYFNLCVSVTQHLWEQD